MSRSGESYQELVGNEVFIRRHIGPSQAETEEILKFLGCGSLDDLTDKVVPASIRREEPLDIGAPMTESKALEKMREIASRNKPAKSLIGMGYYGCHTPNVILRNIMENPAWYTAYTPYQAEISQGRLEAMLNFQTMVTDLTGMEVANASLLDEATAAAEAMAFCKRLSKNKGDTFFVSDDCHPQTIAVIKTRAIPLDINVVVGDPADGLPDDACGVLIQYPGSSGVVSDPSEIIAAAQAQKTMVVVASDLLALVSLKSPGSLGADVVVGSSQRFGVPLGFGGPHAAFFASRDSMKRSIPGRIIGVSVDDNGDPAYRMSLQTREQHIRREKATSNICTAQALLAVMASMYAVYHGPKRLRQISTRTHRLTRILAEGLIRLGYTIEHDSYFDTIKVHTGDWTASVLEACRVEEINLRPYEQHVGISLDETCTRELVERIWALSAFDSLVQLNFDDIDAEVDDAIPEALRRDDDILTHPIFNSHHSETEMLRYMRRLADKDLALDRAMIPLGSCTMKLNATAEMIPVTWPEIGNIHPYAPKDQIDGYLELTASLERMLCDATGYAAVSLQPNAGSQGEFAGLLAIAGYHKSRGEGHRNICLIPSSAHGTNPASAVMAGMKVVVTACDDQGNVDVAELRAKAEEHSENLAALMVTYPSTHGVFEEAITEVCDIIHEHGGQVYLDGANLNAMVGLCAPGKFGSDVSHLNLHKTFCIPHGGGGPGVGPIGVGAHLAPFLPGDPLAELEEGKVGAVSATYFGSASILPISWMYIAMMGSDGLTKATQCAIMNANYIAARLAPHYPVLYTGANGMVAHECILDLRPIKDETGVTVDDVAKRLIDFGFHAPTMSFPVAGTLMIEPTESESKYELDRFCDAMIAIRDEIREIEQGKITAEDSALAHAPHTVKDISSDNWDRKYSRKQAAFPTPALESDKYWSPVRRVDNVYGDKNLVCTCPPVEAYQDAAD